MSSFFFLLFATRHLSLLLQSAFFFFSLWNHLSRNSVMSVWCYVSHYTSFILHHVATFRCECSTVPSASSLHVSFFYFSARTPEQTFGNASTIFPPPKTNCTYTGFKHTCGHRELTLWLISIEITDQQLFIFIYYISAPIITFPNLGRRHPD